MNLDDDELRATKSVRQAYDTVYTEMCRYMDLYNQAEERIKELEKELKRYKKKDENEVTEQELKDMIIGMLE